MDNLTPTMFRVLKLIANHPRRYAERTTYGDEPGYNLRSAEALHRRGLITVEDGGYVITWAGRLIV